MLLVAACHGLLFEAIAASLHQSNDLDILVPFASLGERLARLAILRQRNDHLAAPLNDLSALAGTDYCAVVVALNYENRMRHKNIFDLAEVFGSPRIHTFYHTCLAWMPWVMDTDSKNEHRLAQ